MCINGQNGNSNWRSSATIITCNASTNTHSHIHTHILATQSCTELKDICKQRKLLTRLSLEKHLAVDGRKKNYVKHSFNWFTILIVKRFGLESHKKLYKSKKQWMTFRCFANSKKKVTFHSLLKWDQKLDYWGYDSGFFFLRLRAWQSDEDFKCRQ